MLDASFVTITPTFGTMSGVIFCNFVAVKTAILKHDFGNRPRLETHLGNFRCDICKFPATKSRKRGLGKTLRKERVLVNVDLAVVWNEIHVATC